MVVFVNIFFSKHCGGFQVAERLGRREPCAKCGLPVFIAERLLVSGRTLYHRTCFRCARCQNQLSLVNFYETEGGEYCCETCPDEVLDSSNHEDKSQVASQNDQANLDVIGHAGPEDEYSAEFELALEKSLVPHVIEVKEQPELKISKARSDFMSSQLTFPQLKGSEKLSSVSDNKETLPHPQQQDIDNSKENGCSFSSQHSALEGQNVDHASCSSSNTSSLSSVDKSGSKVCSECSIVNIVNTPPLDSVTAKCSDSKSDISSVVEDRLLLGNGVPIKVSSTSLNSVVGDKQLEARNDSAAPEDHNKEQNSSGDLSSSIVRMRLKLFEKSSNTEESTKALKTRSNNISALYQKDETSSAPLDMLITRSTSVESKDRGFVVEEGKVERQEVQNGQESSVRKTGISKEKRGFENNENVSVGLALKKESHTRITDSVEYMDAKDRIASKKLSNISDIQETDTTDIPKDTGSIKVLESGDIQTNFVLPKSVVTRQENDHTYPNELNPFGDEDDDDDNVTEHVNEQNAICKPSESEVAKEMNPFGSSDDEEMQSMVDLLTPPVPATRGRRKMLEAPKVNLNPFWSDGEEPSSEDENTGSTCSTSEKLPVPRPRTVM